MRIISEHPDRLSDFIRFLRDGGCIVLRLDEHTAEALVPNVASPLTERRELQRYLESWQKGNGADSAPAAADAASPARALAAVA